ncbi:MAG: response regulator [Elusimicrobia bacterium]|nr:response regulator [Elusimicrobiota bacterium]
MSAETARVLIVDPDASCRDRFRAALNRGGHIASAAADGSQALELLRREKAQVVVCELALPDMEGLELLRRAKAADPAVSFLMVAPQVPRSGAAEVIRRGAYHFLQKPVDDELLLLIVGTIHETQGALAKTKAQLLQASKLASLGELAAGVAHELNNPLTSVIGFSHWLLKAKNLTPEQREDIERIYKESKRCGQIVQNMLQFARRKPSQEEAIDLGSVVHDALELFRCTCRGIAVSTEAPGGAPWVTGDRPQLHQALLQILSNAKDAVAGRKEPVISVRLIREGGKAVVTIKDNGVGIPAAALGRVFDPFYSTKPQGQGSGLGLSVAYGIVKQSGGAIEVASVEGQGTEVRVELPMVEVPA